MVNDTRCLSMNVNIIRCQTEVVTWLTLCFELLYLLVAKRRFCVVMRLVVKKPNRPFDIWTRQSRKQTGVHMNDE